MMIGIRLCLWCFCNWGRHRADEEGNILGIEEGYLRSSIEVRVFEGIEVRALSSKVWIPWPREVPS
jgi:hypothetical protein